MLHDWSRILRYTIHLKPSTPLNLVKKLEHLLPLKHISNGLLSLLRAHNSVSNIKPRLKDRMIHFETEDPNVIKRIYKMYRNDINCVISDAKMKGAFKRHSLKLDAKDFKPKDQPVPLTPPQVAKAYNFPAPKNASQRFVAIVELGGGYNPDAIAAYCKSLGVAAPNLVAAGVSGASNSCDGYDGADDEVQLDVEIVASVCPGVNIVTFFAPNTLQGFIDGIVAAGNYKFKPDAISISWGSPERMYEAGTRAAMDAAIKSAITGGIPVFIAAGDNGSTDGVGDGQQHVDYPGSSPYSISCGGTRLSLNAIGGRQSEVVWSAQYLDASGATGGGISDVYQRPAYQNAITTTAAGAVLRRCVPDISGNADPASGYTVTVDTVNTFIGGTSAVAPLYAALAAICGGYLGRPPGDLHEILYSNSAIFFDVIQGSNGAYKAGPGFDLCSGLGVLDGTKLLGILQSQPATLGQKLKRFFLGG